MPYDSKIHTGGLHRLAAECYRGMACVHWSMTIDHRSTGWLTPLHHAQLRELLCHALARYSLLCPAYCLMPDHSHFMWLGFASQSDQLLAARAFRLAWNDLLGRAGIQLQKQGFDNVITGKDRPAFTNAANYILNNPARGQLVDAWPEYPHLGAVIPGYAEFDPRANDFWPRFWRLFDCLAKRGSLGGFRYSTSPA